MSCMDCQEYFTHRLIITYFLGKKAEKDNKGRYDMNACDSDLEANFGVVVVEQAPLRDVCVSACVCMSVFVFVRDVPKLFVLT